VVDVAPGEREPWSDGEVPRNARRHLEWGADGERLCFHRDEDGDERNDVGALESDGDRIAYATTETDDVDNRTVYVANADGPNAWNLERRLSVASDG
jgi:hypothetical protein